MMQFTDFVTVYTPYISIWRPAPH